MKNNRGFTLVELLVVMGIFIIVMIIISNVFENILRKAGQQVKSAATNTEGVVGLEMLRSDLEHTGFGVPHTIATIPAGGFDEVATTANPVTGINSSSYNANTPHAIRIGYTPVTNKIINGSSNTNPEAAYLVIRSTRVALHDTAKKWTFVNYSFSAGANSSYIKKWNVASDDIPAGHRVITIRSAFSLSGAPEKALAMNGSAFSYQMPGDAIPHPEHVNYMPGDASQLCLVYGVDPGALRMPYNRADYYIKKPADTDPVKMSGSCNPGTGVLYKGLVRHADGTFQEYPLLDCVGDMQVEFEIDQNNDGNISYSPLLKINDPPVTGPLRDMTAAEIRSMLKNVRIYLLAQEGKIDRNYTYPYDPVRKIKVGDAARPTSSGRTWDGSATCTTNCMQTVFGADWQHYRWKVYTIVVQLKNL